MTKNFLISSLLTILVFAYSTMLNATESKFILYGNGNYDFSSPASCAPKQSSSIDKLAQLSKKIDESQPLIININGKSCLIHDENKSSVHSIIEEMSTLASNDSDNKALKKAFPKDDVKNVIDSKNLTLCDADLEKWVIASFAKKSIQPYDIAGIGIAHLSEIKLLIFGGGLVAGMAGDHVGATCMSVIGAGVSYACDKGWLHEK